MTKIKYLVTSDFDDLPISSIYRSKIVKYCDNKDNALVFHPPGNNLDGSCGSIEMCRLADYPSNTWVELHEDAYINLTKSDLQKFIKSLQKIYDNWPKK